MQHRQQGFTLIEIAIVLVIIGVLLGGILKGQEMLTQSKIRAIEKELDGVAIAILGYRDRYKALPGDDIHAKTRWNNATEGDGNGIIDGTFNATDNAEASLRVWQHLRLAGLIGGDAETGKQPSNATGGITGIASNAAGSIIVCTTNLPAKIANAIDTNQDDGLPEKGSIQAYEQTAHNTPKSDLATAYKDDGSTQYTICRNV